ncbi:hypothetical protein DTO164E3_2431 [Paecilomyces variotii]|nr:hypothetical protein DTO164E3_2431 [Paecilomyces variotii]KAJ9206850.1 hypothetical protein DTO032I3_1438 [Paecilomyces variotii]KAJ9281363.1 hypothetical protein DTO021D3_1586 [Paecilomyces variotii]KAJ9290380.1 hypothetical protein DTO021C3_2004 [Paecilomyces variotii]KAJ9346622.1 hypothetical protein DTO027B6_876 [Paecilomyces variotii]
MASQQPAFAGSDFSVPMSVEQITRMAQDYEYNPMIPLRYWLRSAASLLKEASIYESEGHDEQAYLLLFRHAQLVLVHLADHPEAKSPNNRKALIQAERDVKQNLKKLEFLKPRINKRYERYSQLMEQRQTRKSTPTALSDTVPAQNQLPPDPALTRVPQPLEAGENRELAVRLAQKELDRRATVRNASRQISSQEGQERRIAGAWDDWGQGVNRSGRGADDDLSRRIQEVRMNIDHQAINRPHSARNDHVQNTIRRPSAQTSQSTYKYPSVPKHRQPDVYPVPTEPHKSDSGLFAPPERPPKETIHLAQPAVPDLPPRPDKVSSPPPLPEKGTPVAGAAASQSDLNPSTFTFKPSAYLENGTPLRTVFLPPTLRTRFLSLASDNTRRNLETCGILCGTLISNALFVSKLLIPEQESTSDTCETVNESAVFDYCDSEDLMVLGWIHTHPTQTCFMSSRDLHTHSGYQVMLPESIAIVCAPSKDPDWGVFRLTDPPGLKSILSCTQTGLFHPHAQTNIYTDALRPGHVFEAKGLEFEVVDLRPR